MRFKNILYAAAAAMALTACQSDDAIETVQLKSQFPEDGVMRFTTNLVDPTIATTRASITGSDVNQNGQQFQVKIVNPTSATYSYFYRTVRRLGVDAPEPYALAERHAEHHRDRRLQAGQDIQRL